MHITLIILQNVYPQLHQKIRSRDTAGVDTIIKNLENIVRGLIRKAAHAVDVLEEAEKSVHYGKHFHDHLHQKAKGLLKDKNVCPSLHLTNLQFN